LHVVVAALLAVTADTVPKFIKRSEFFWELRARTAADLKTSRTFSR
jgi:hypothetical protein